MIYLLEDDESIRKLVIYALASQGYEAEGFERPEEFWAALEQKVPRLVLLDIMLPGQDGISILRQLRARPDTASLPVVLLTARTAEYDRVEGLDAGADDYIPKPFGIMELLARVRAVLRRTEVYAQQKYQLPADQEYQLGTLRVWPDRHEASVDGEPIHLTYKEFSLLCLLLENQGRVLTREVLLDRIWGLGEEPGNRTLDVHIRTLRAKLGPAGRCIETVRGVGYRISGESL